MIACKASCADGETPTPLPSGGALDCSHLLDLNTKERIVQADEKGSSQLNWGNSMLEGFESYPFG